jgi:hypothetical protein
MNSYDEWTAQVELDLDPIKVKLMHKESGENWSLQKVNAVEAEYRRFLFLTKTFPTEEISPSVDVDTFWHYHILDTMKYAQDCQEIFGYFLHHFPYLGMRGEDDLRVREETDARTRSLYEQAFSTAAGAAGHGQNAAGAQGGSDNAWCSSAGKKAWCSVTAKQAWCSVTDKKAWCSVTAKPAWCSVTAKSAWCSKPVEGKAAAAPAGKLAWCSVTAKSAWCSVTAQPAWCSVTASAQPAPTEAAWCSVTNGKQAWCSVTRKPDFATRATVTRELIAA